MDLFRRDRLDMTLEGNMDRLLGTAMRGGRGGGELCELRVKYKDMKASAAALTIRHRHHHLETSSSFYFMPSFHADLYLCVRNRENVVRIREMGHEMVT